MAADPGDAFINFFSDRTQANPMLGASIHLSGNIVKDMDELNIPIGVEGTALMGMFYQASMIPTSTLNRGFNDMNDLVVTAKFPRGYIPDKSTPTSGNEVVTRGPNHPSGEPPTYFPERATPDDYGDYKGVNISNCPDPELRSLYSAIVKGSTDWKQFLIDLLGANCVTPITPTHVKSYFAWKGSHNVEGEIISRHFASMTGGMPKVPQSDQMRAMMTDGKWKEYRLSFATSSSLLKKMLDDIPEHYTSILSNVTKQRINEAVMNSWSESHHRKIPEKALAVLYAYLLATNQLVDDLWGPRKSYESLSLSEKTSLSNWFKEAHSKLKVFNGGVVNRGELPESLRDI